MRVEVAAIGEIIIVNNIEDSARRVEEIDKDTEIFLIKENKIDDFVARSYKNAYSNSKNFVAD